jgi:DNA-binding MarR family transcriptional regulator
MRMAARAVSRVYDAALRPAGLRTTQFSILSRLGEEGPLAVGHLAHRLAMERTTVTRELAVLARRGLVVPEPAGDRRRRLASLTDAGADALAAAQPLWRDVQGHLADELGSRRVDELRRELDRAVRAANALLAAGAP